MLEPEPAVKPYSNRLLDRENVNGSAEFRLRNAKRTPWFPADVKPIREGVYERDLRGDFPNCLRFSYWDGENWGGWSMSVAGARPGTSSRPHAPWRGLAAPSTSRAKE